MVNPGFGQGSGVGGGGGVVIIFSGSLSRTILWSSLVLGKSWKPHHLRYCNISLCPFSRTEPPYSPGSLEIQLHDLQIMMLDIGLNHTPWTTARRDGATRRVTARRDGTMRRSFGVFRTPYVYTGARLELSIQIVHVHIIIKPCV